MATSQKLFPSGAIEVSFRVANTSAPKTEMEFWQKVVDAAREFGYQTVETSSKNDSRDLSKVFSMRFSDKEAPVEEEVAA